MPSGGPVNPDWEGIRRDIVERLTLLEEVWGKLDAPESTRAAIWNDLIMPALLLLGKFCSCVRINSDDEPNTGHAD